MSARKKIEGVFYAVKEIRETRWSRLVVPDMLVEVRSLSRLYHKNIVR